VRVLFVPREDAPRIFGGDVVQMRKTADALRALEIEVDVGTVQLASEHPYDIVHLWTSLHTPGVLTAQLNALEPVRACSRVALSTIWAPHHLVRWMDAARRWLFTIHQDGASISLRTAERELRQIAARTLDFTLDGGRMTAFAPHPFTHECRSVLARVDLILPNSWMELQAIFAYLGDFAEYSVVPNAVDAIDFEGADPDEVPQELRGAPFALMCARFDTRKQQDFAMLAVKELGFPIVFVGERTDAEIFARMQAIAKGARAPVYHYPFASHERLRHLYAGGRVHLLPSIFESPGLSSLEAALLDCSVVTGNLAFESEYFRDAAYYCDPCDAFSIARAVEKAWNGHDADRARRERLRERIVSDFTWSAAARATLNGYYRIS
jgi:glycosyltransferase involved in cell wall biosynthesis